MNQFKNLREKLHSEDCGDLLERGLLANLISLSEMYQ